MDENFHLRVGQYFRKFKASEPINSAIAEGSDELTAFAKCWEIVLAQLMERKNAPDSKIKNWANYKKRAKKVLKYYIKKKFKCKNGRTSTDIPQNNVAI